MMLSSALEHISLDRGFERRFVGASLLGVSRGEFT